MCRVGPLRLAACGLSTNQRAYLPRRVPAAILIPFLQHKVTDFGAGERVRERGPAPEARSPASAQVPRQT